MNKIYLFAIASILATASLMAGTFTSTAIAQDPTIPGSEMGSTIPGSEMGSTIPGSEMGSTTDPMSSNMTATDGNATGTDNSTAPM